MVVNLLSNIFAYISPLTNNVGAILLIQNEHLNALQATVL